MLTFIARRLLALIPLMLIVSFLVFSLVVFLPGDPAESIAGGPDASPEDIAKVREQTYKEGMKSLRISGAMKVAAGVTTFEEVLKAAPPMSERDAYLREGVACYQNFLRGLLDVTDNLVQGKVVPPKDVNTLVEKLKTQKGIVIDQQIIPGANHFFDGKLEPLMETVTGYLDMRLANVR